MSDIAIVGMACHYPDANTPKALWENVLTQRQAFRRLPAERLNLADYPEITCQQAAVIEGYEFDRIKYQISGSTYRSTDLTHWLALDIAAQALSDAGFQKGQGLDKARTGVLVGNTLTGEFSRAELMRLRWPYVARMVKAGLDQQDWDNSKVNAFITDLESQYKQAFAPITEDTLAGGLANTIAGRICNYFDFGGGGYTLDGACSSSLLAIANGCRALVADEVDSVLVGGVDLSLDPFELMGFSAVGALTKNKMRVYDAQSQGFLPGEGCGFMVLMRHQDAIACGASCYAVLKGWGISSDGSGGMTRPEQKGQTLAIQRAYQQAGYSVDSVALFEGHGTGTKVGDAVELKTLLDIRSEAAIPAVIGSIKANIGHTKAASGMAGLLKAVMAVKQQMLPPTTGVQNPHPLLKDQSLTVLSKGRVWTSEKPLRAGISSFGFGGINVHLTIESTAKTPITTPPYLLSSPQQSELFFFSAFDFEALKLQLKQIEAIANRLSLAELTDLAANLPIQKGTVVRAAIVANTPAQLADKLKRLISAIDAGQTQLFAKGLCLFDRIGKISFLFTGQGAPVRLTGGAVAERFPSIQALYQNAGLATKDDHSTAVAQPAIITAEIAGLKLLQQFGIEAKQAIGHSLGELTALYWASAMSEDDLLALAKVRGMAMNQSGETAGAMLSVVTTAEIAESFCNPEIQIACYNSTNQIVFSGTKKAIQHLQQTLQGKGLKSTLLKVGNGFHSKLMQTAAEQLQDYFNTTTFKPLKKNVISTITGQSLGVNSDLKTLLTTQLTHPVRFIQALKFAIKETDLFIEIGTGQILNGLVQQMSAIPTVSLDIGGSSLDGLLNSLAAAYVVGSPIQSKDLFKHRFSRSFSLDWQPQFFSNPCEASLTKIDSIPENIPTAVINTETDSVLEQLRQQVAKHAELPLEAIQDNSRLLADLHLNSIIVGQIVSEVGHQMGLNALADPTAYAGASLTEIANAIEDRIASGEVITDEAEDKSVMGVDSWIRPFIADSIATERPALQYPPKGTGNWQFFGTSKTLEKSLNTWGGKGIALVLADQNDLGLLLQASQAVTDHDYFILIQHQQGSAAFIRSLFQEQPQLTVLVITLADDHQLVERVLAEIQTVNQYQEIEYNQQGIRYQRQITPFIVKNPVALEFATTDLILVTGGGKGITAECAATLANQYGVRLALLGRALPENDTELAGNLARFKKMGLDFQYYSVDITDCKAIQQLIPQLGKVKAVIHGAGMNQPALINNLSETQLKQTLAPKVDGLNYLLAALPELPILINFGSIIGAAGMAGEAHYALANARLSQITPANCHCLTLEWSVWSEIGMGRRLGSDEILAQQGITPISPDIGLALFERALSEGWKGNIIVTGRMPECPTLPMVKPDLPFLRFIEARTYTPKIELISEITLNLATDPYLKDHIFNGQQLFPAVMALEAMAQVAGALIESSQVPIFENIRFAHPIIVEDNESIQIAALIKTSGQVELVVRCAKTHFKMDHFSATCIFDQATTKTAVSINQSSHKNIPAKQLYDDLLFQTGRFKRLQSYQTLNATQCIANIAKQPEQPWFGSFLPPKLMLADAGSRDATIHAIQACIPHSQLLPVGVERLDFVDPHVQGPWIVSAKEQWQKDDLFCYDIQVTGENGSIREIWHGLHLHRVAKIQWDTGWDNALLAPYIQRRIQELLPKSRFDCHQDGLLETDKRPDGKPHLIHSDLAISASHSPDFNLVVTAKQQISCDLEPVIQREQHIWQDLLGDHHDLVALISEQSNESMDQAATRIWTAKECLKKIGALAETPLTFKTKQDDWIIFNAGEQSIASSVLLMKKSQKPLALAVLVGVENAL